MIIIDSGSNNFIKKLMGFSVGPFISALLGFIMIPLTTWYTNPEEFGKSSMYTVGFTLASLIIYLGMDQAFVREFNSYKDRIVLLWSSFTVPFIFSILLSVILLVFYKPISIMMFGSIEWYIMLILALSVPFAVIDRFSQLIIRMNEKALLFSVVNIMNKVFNLIFLLIYLIYIDNSFKGIVNASFIALVVVTVIEVIITKEYWFNSITVSKKLMKQLFHFALPLIPATIIGWVFSSMDRVLLRSLSSFEQIGLYSAAFKITTILGIIQQAFANFWVPTAYRWYEEKVEKEKFLEVSDYLTIVMTFIFILVVVFRDIIFIFFSSEYKAAAEIVPFLLFFPIMYTMSETTTLGIVFKRKTKYNIVVSVLAAVTNFILNYLFVPQYGALGSAIATAISYIMFFWLRTCISSKLWIKFNYQVYIVNTIVMIALAFCELIFKNSLINCTFIIIFFIVNFGYMKKMNTLGKNYINNFKKKSNDF